MLIDWKVWDPSTVLYEVVNKIIKTRVNKHNTNCHCVLCTTNNIYIIKFKGSQNLVQRIKYFPLTWDGQAQLFRTLHYLLKMWDFRDVGSWITTTKPIGKLKKIGSDVKNHDKKWSCHVMHVIIINVYVCVLTGIELLSLLKFPFISVYLFPSHPTIVTTKSVEGTPDEIWQT